ncbi:MAG: SPOR domain-containing protein [Betaproteobacteria bacterium]
MALRTEASDPAVDDLKRRARRRLVGAIVLALAAAVILPLLLESDPKPLGDEVSVRIPPVDNSRFVNPLSPERGPDAGAATPDAKTAPRKSIADAERRALGQPATSTPRSDAAPATSAPSSAAPKPEAAAKSDGAAVKPQPAAPLPAATADPSRAKVDSEAPKGEPSKVEAPKADAAKSDAAKSDTSKTAAPAPAKSSAATANPEAVPGPGAFVVQVGAFVDTKAASDLAAQVKLGGFVAYTEAVPTTHGTVRRVRVGPFATRAEADAALAKLKAAGYDRALVTPTK